MDSRAIVTRNLCKDFRVGFAMRKVRILHDLNLEVRKGEVFGYLGPNGAGKTTTIKLLMGLILPTAGEALLLGGGIGSTQVRARIGFLPENPYFYDHLTGWEFLDYCGRLFGMRKASRDLHVRRVLEEMGLQAVSQTALRKYSKGMIQKIGLAQALMHQPELVILDEPMSGLDPVGRKEVRDLIRSLKAEGKTVFFSTHILPDVEMICDRVGIIVDGRLRQVGVLEEMLEAQTESIEITVREADAGRVSALPLPLSSPPLQRGDKTLLSVSDERALQEALFVLAAERVRILAVVPQRKTLEDYFLQQVSPPMGGRVEGA